MKVEGKHKKHTNTGYGQEYFEYRNIIGIVYEICQCVPLKQRQSHQGQDRVRPGFDSHFTDNDEEIHIEG
jgi:hypothetical protein